MVKKGLGRESKIINVFVCRTIDCILKNAHQSRQLVVIDDATSESLGTKIGEYHKVQCWVRCYS